MRDETRRLGQRKTGAVRLASAAQLCGAQCRLPCEEHRAPLHQPGRRGLFPGLRCCDHSGVSALREQSSGPAGRWPPDLGRGQDAGALLQYTFGSAAAALCRNGRAPVRVGRGGGQRSDRGGKERAALACRRQADGACVERRHVVPARPEEIGDVQRTGCGHCRSGFLRSRASRKRAHGDRSIRIARATPEALNVRNDARGACLDGCACGLVSEGDGCSFHGRLGGKAFELPGVSKACCCSSRGKVRARDRRHTRRRPLARSLIDGPDSFSRFQSRRTCLSTFNIDSVSAQQ